jgi:hypothetical protein
MLLVLFFWLAFAILASPFSTHPVWETFLTGAESVFLNGLQDKRYKYQWKAGTYRGITIGKSTAIELLQKWGTPKWSGHWEWDNPTDPKFLLYDYDAQEGLRGKIRVEAETKTGKVTSIEISPDELFLNEATELFGKDFIDTRYKFCECDLGDGAPIYESPDGNLRHIEYRSRGIAMSVNYEERITSIEFVDKPIGFKSSKECEQIPECKPQRKNVKRKR